MGVGIYEGDLENNIGVIWEIGAIWGRIIQ